MKSKLNALIKSAIRCDCKGVGLCRQFRSYHSALPHCPLTLKASPLCCELPAVMG
ncbi:hypothetical protein KCP74_21595 [Salmonella enterica subsp. enterica]|nr:hypothetical protein KCP74_21595 [Salmonella enterica subsp. enterica]